MEPVTTKERLLPRGGADGLRWQYQQERDERLFRAAWFEQFHACWRRALRLAQGVTPGGRASKGRYRITEWRHTNERLRAGGNSTVPLAEWVTAVLATN